MLCFACESPAVRCTDQEFEDGQWYVELQCADCQTVCADVLSPQQMADQLTERMDDWLSLLS